MINAIDCDLSSGVCPTCHKPGRPTLHRNCPVKMGRGPFGPGTELRAIFKSLSVEPVEGCDCNRLMAWMDWVGVEGCVARRDEMLARLGENYKLYGIADKIKAGALAVVKGLPLSLEGLFNLAVQRAEEKAAQS